MSAESLQGAERDAGLAQVTERGWTHDGVRDAITKTFVFADFNEAFGWMTRVAILADKMDHHPEWSNVYKTVEVTLTTHDVDGLSTLDMALAERMDAMAGS